MRNYFNDTCALSDLQVLFIDFCICAIVALTIIGLWLAAASKFDRELFESDQRHFKDQEVQQRRNAAAIQICGNGNAMWIDDTTLQCKARKGKSVVTAKL